MRLSEWARNSSTLPAPVRHRFTEEELANPVTALAKWLRSDAGPHSTAYAQACVDALESRYGIRIPQDFRRYLLEAAPRFEFNDDENTTWWTPGRIRNIPEEYGQEISDPAIGAEAGTYLFFADYLVWCWAWAVCCSDGPNRSKVALIGGDPDGFVADSFSDFVERYLRDPAGVANTFPPGGPVPRATEE